MGYCNSLKENHSLCFRYLEQKLLYFITPHVRAPNEQKRETYVMLILYYICSSLRILSKWSKVYLDIFNYFWRATVLEFLDLKSYSTYWNWSHFQKFLFCMLYVLYAWVMSYFLICNRRNSFFKLSADLANSFVWVNWEHLFKGTVNIELTCSLSSWSFFFLFFTLMVVIFMQVQFLHWV